MAGEATIAQSAAILKTRYKDGKPPGAAYKNFKFFSTVAKATDFTGQNKSFSVTTENTQGVAPDFTNAITALGQSTFKNFLVTPLNLYSLARIRGDALKRAQGNTGSMVDLWKNETDAAVQTAMKMHEIYCFRSGNGVLGTLDGTSSVAATTIPLLTAADIANFDLGATVQAVSDTTLSPTLRTGSAVITGIDRALGKLTFGSNLSAQITGVANTDSLVRLGTASVSGTAAVFTGVDQWQVGGAAPAALYGCTRSTDPVRTAGQQYDATGVPYEDALIEAEARLISQGYGTDLTVWINPLDLKDLKKSLIGKVIFEKTQINGSGVLADLSFKGVQIDGENGPIKIMSNPFTPKGTVYMHELDAFSFESAGAAIQLQDYDSNNFLRITSDDLYQVSFATYGQLFCYRPYSGIRILNWGA